MQPAKTLRRNLAAGAALAILILIVVPLLGDTQPRTCLTRTGTLPWQFLY